MAILQGKHKNNCHRNFFNHLLFNNIFQKVATLGILSIVSMIVNSICVYLISEKKFRNYVTAQTSIHVRDGPLENLWWKWGRFEAYDCFHQHFPNFFSLLQGYFEGFLACMNFFRFIFPCKNIYFLLHSHPPTTHTLRSFLIISLSKLYHFKTSNILHLLQRSLFA